MANKTVVATPMNYPLTHQLRLQSRVPHLDVIPIKKAFHCVLGRLQRASSNFLIP